MDGNKLVWYLSMNLAPVFVQEPSLTANQAFLERFLPPTSNRFHHIVEVAIKGNGAVEAWLHDIGYAPALAKTGFHPLDGGWFAMERGFPPLVVKAVLFHSGAYREAKFRGGAICEVYDLLFPLVTEEDWQTINQLTYWDMTTSPTGETVTVNERIAEILSRYPKESAVHQTINELKTYFLEVEQTYKKANPV